MTAFSSSDLPASIDSVEKLAVWANVLLSELYPNEKVYEEVGEAPVLRATSIAADIPFPTDDQWTYNRYSLFIGRVSLDLDASYKSGTKFWEAVNSLGTATIPDNFKAAA